MRFFGGEIDDIGAVANHNRKPGGVMNPNTHALMLFIAYRRIRRSIGRQPFQPKRMKVRMVVLALAGLAFVAMSTMAPVDGPRSVSPFAGAIGNPITTGVFFVEAGYYLTYYAGLLRRGSPQPAA